MVRRAGIVAVASVVVSAVLAVAQGPGPYALPEPALTAAEALRLPSAGSCVPRAVRVRLTPPDGVALDRVAARVAGERVLRLTRVSGRGWTELVLPYGRSRVRLDAETVGGQVLRTRRSYRRCRPGEPRRPVPAPGDAPEPPVSGGEG